MATKHPRKPGVPSQATGAARTPAESRPGETPVQGPVRASQARRAATRARAKAAARSGVRQVARAREALRQVGPRAPQVHVHAPPAGPTPRRPTVNAPNVPASVATVPSHGSGGGSNPPSSHGNWITSMGWDINAGPAIGYTGSQLYNAGFYPKAKTGSVWSQISRK